MVWAFLQRVDAGSALKETLQFSDEGTKRRGAPKMTREVFRK